MLNTLKQWWHEDQQSGPEQPKLSLYITKLMVGMMSMDGKLDQRERDEIVKLLGEHYGQSRLESMALIEKATDSDLKISDIVRRITSEFDIQQRTEILSQIWQIALADGEVDFLEEQYINRLSSLIKVPVEALTQAKQRPESAMLDLQQAARFQPHSATIH